MEAEGTGRADRAPAPWSGRLAARVDLFPLHLLAPMDEVKDRPYGRTKDPTGLCPPPARRRDVPSIGCGLCVWGALSPFVFFAAGLASLFWRSLVRGLPRSDVVPVRDSILVRPRLMPFTWSAVAELKPGSDDFARAASSFSGKLLVFTDTGKVYSVPSCFALSKGEAEAKIMDEFRREALAGRAGAFLLPLDSIQATGVLSRNLSRMKNPMEQIARSAPRIPGALFIECGGGHVLRASVLDQTPAPKPKLPGDPEVMSNPPLTWEVFESVAKGTRWPQPDSLSNLLDSMVATRGVPLAERVRGLETEGDGLKIQSLSGDEVRASRTQLRALVSLYS